jgi:hypothetical protein
MNATALVATLWARGVVLTVHEDRLRVDAPAGVLSAEDHAALAAYKPELLVLLTRWWDGPPWNGQISEAEFRAALAFCIERRGYYTPTLLQREPALLDAWRAAYHEAHGAATACGGRALGPTDLVWCAECRAAAAAGGAP